MKTNPGYESLAGVLQRALDQAQDGKGAERHANSLPFHQQPMQTIARAHGVGFLTGQASKKGEECHGLPHTAKIAELLGAINYLAGAVIFLEGQQPKAPDNDNLPDGFLPFNVATDRVPKVDVSAVILRKGLVISAESVTHFEFGRMLDDPEREIVGYKPHG